MVSTIREALPGRHFEFLTINWHWCRAWLELGAQQAVGADGLRGGWRSLRRRVSLVEAVRRCAPVRESHPAAQPPYVMPRGTSQRKGSNHLVGASGDAVLLAPGPWRCRRRSTTHLRHNERLQLSGSPGTHWTSNYGGRCGRLARS
jgi:hypothetical protein